MSGESGNELVTLERLHSLSSVKNIKTLVVNVNEGNPLLDHSPHKSTALNSANKIKEKKIGFASCTASQRC